MINNDIVEQVYDSLFDESGYSCIPSINRAIFFREFDCEKLRAIFGLDEKLPQVVSMNEFEQLETEPMYSGCCAFEKYLKRFIGGQFKRIGEYRNGANQGCGFYFANKFDDAKYYSGDYDDGGIITVKPTDGIKLVARKDLEQMCYEEGISTGEYEHITTLRGKPLPQVTSIDEKKYVLGKTFGQFRDFYTYFGLMYGFDGVYDQKKSGEKFISIANRSAVIMSEVANEN